MSNDQFDGLLKQMPKIAKAVKAFESEAVQALAFQAMMVAIGNDGGTVGNRPDSPPPEQKRNSPNKSSPQHTTTEDLASFFESFDHSKPAENVKLIVAWLYSLYGVFSITKADIQDLADSAGLTVAPRSDNTMRQAKAKGRALFTQQGNGWKLTLAGETYMKNTYGVKKGNKPRPKGDTE